MAKLIGYQDTVAPDLAARATGPDSAHPDVKANVQVVRTYHTIPPGADNTGGGGRPSSGQAYPRGVR